MNNKENTENLIDVVVIVFAATIAVWGTTLSFIFS